MTDRETIAIYGEKAETYASLPMDQDQIDALDMFCHELEIGARVLDLGCGPGSHAADLIRRGFDVTALDATAEFVATARARGVDAHLGTFDDLTEVAAYDGIWASFSLLHAPKADFPRHIAACKTALRAGGTLFIGMKLGTGEARDRIGRYYSYYSEAELCEILGMAGFDRLHTRTGEGKGLAGTMDPFIVMTAHA